MAAPSIALVNRALSPAEAARLAAVADALQTQVERDFVPVWGGLGARIAPAAGTAAPPGTWPIYIVQKPRAGLGVHLDHHGHPFAEVQATADWTVTASHELMEMLADPHGSRLATGPDIAPGSGKHPVQYLVEICDPCETFGYAVGDVQVSDFVTPDYYRAGAAPGTAFDFLRQLTGPLEVPPGGYLSWQDPSDGHWHQKRPDGTFVRSSGRIDRHDNPRAGRDHAFGQDPERHDLHSIRRAAAVAATGP